MVTKQAVINSSNKLDASYVGLGTVTNSKLDTLSDIETSETIQSQLNGIKTSLENLDSLQDIDIVSIANLVSNVSSVINDVSDLKTFQTNQGT
jgi:hypothetical protein